MNHWLIVFLEAVLVIVFGGIGCAPDNTAPPSIPPVTPTPTPISGLPVIAEFYAESTFTGLGSGGSTSLIWDVVGSKFINLYTSTCGGMSHEQISPYGTEEVRPRTSTKYTITAENRVGEVRKSVEIVYADTPMSPSIIISGIIIDSGTGTPLTIKPNYLIPTECRHNTTYKITCLASDANNGNLNYMWCKTGGISAANQTGATFIWTSPVSVMQTDFWVTVSDGKGASTQCSFSVLTK